jgi:hypothetical protein
MATVIGLGVQFSANANGMTKGLSQVDRQLQNLGKQAAAAGSLFSSFTASSAAAGAAQQQVATDIAFLSSAFKTGQISAQEYASELQAVVGSAQTAAAAFAEGARITEQVATAEERRTGELERLGQLLAQGAVSEQTYSRAVAQTTGATQAAAAAIAKAESDRAKAISEGAAVAASVQTQQEQREAELARLAGLLQQGVISEETYSRAVFVTSGAHEAAQNAEAARAQLLQEGQAISARYATAEETRAATIARLDALLEAGAITQETYMRASIDAIGINEQAAQSEEERAKATARAAQITQANLTPQQKYDDQVQELSAHLAAGRISQDTYNSALNKAATEWAKATMAADKFGDSVDGAGDGGTMKFNELSGVLSALPGPIGNVAGRLSGLSSAGEGLSKVFGGGAGLSGGLTNIGASVAGLVNPFTVGLAAVAAFGAGASAVASGLLDLEDRVEKLGNTADKLGVSFEFIQLLEEAGNRSGVSIESVSSAFGKLQKTLAGADEESKAATAALAKLGIAFTDLENLSPEEQIRLIGEQLQGIDDPAKRTAAAMQIFGKSGADLLPFFANLGPAADDIERLGGSLTAIDRGRIDDFGAGIDALGVASSRLGELLLLPFVGLGEGIAQGSAEFLGGINAIVGPIGDVLEPLLSNFGSVVEVVGVIIGGLGRNIGAVLAPFGDLIQAVGSVSEGFNEAFVEIVRYLVDASVATTEWLVSFSPIGAVADSLGAIGETVSRVANIIGTALSQVGGSVGNVVGSWAEFFGIESAIESIGNTISSVFGSVSSTFQAISASIGGTVGQLLTIAEDYLGITAEVAVPVAPELDLSQPSLAAAQFAKDIGAAATAAAEFGAAGFDAALAYQNSLEQIAKLQADGTLTAEEAKRAAEQEKAAFEAKIQTLDKEAEAQARTAEAAQKAADEKIAAAERAAAAAVDADRKLADAFITAQGLGGGDGATPADTLLAIVRQIEETEAAIVEARAAGDAAAEQAATRRLAVLDQAQAAAEEASQFGFSTQDAERAIDSVRDKLDETFSFVNFELAPEAFTAAQEQLAQLEADLDAKIIDPETFEQAADAIRSGFEDALKTAEQIRDLNEQYAQRAAEIEADRLDALSQVSQQTVQATDVRTSEGASEFLRLATGREDPAIGEYRKQLSELQKIAREIGKLGGVVDIVGAA